VDAELTNPSAACGPKPASGFLFSTNPMRTFLVLTLALFALPTQAAEPAPPSLRTAIGQAVDLLKTHEKTYPDQFRSPGPSDDFVTFGEKLIDLQKEVAFAEYELAGQLGELETLEKARGNETRQWQAAFDYTVARLQYRIAFLREYNTMLARMRKGDAPELDPTRHIGWQLAAKDDATNTDREAAVLTRKARVLLERVARDYKGTPWELLARRDLLSAGGLEWQPLPK
jgi:hypothetical protein